MKSVPLLVRGRRLVLVIMVSLLVLALWRVTRAIWHPTSIHWFLASILLVIETSLLLQYYDGKARARWLVPFAYGLAGMVGAWKIAVDLDFLTALYSVAYLQAAMVMAASESIEAFLDDQSGKHPPAPHLPPVQVAGEARQVPVEDGKG